MKITLTILVLIFFTSNCLTQQDLSDVIEQVFSKDSGGLHQDQENPTVCLANIDSKVLNLYLEFEDKSHLNDTYYEEILETLSYLFSIYEIVDLQVFVKTVIETQYENLLDYMPNEPIEIYQTPQNKDPFEDLSYHKGINPHTGQGLPSGSLSGKTVWLSPGHGYIYDNINAVWKTQRISYDMYVEDFGTVEGVNYFLQKYLMNAGANVWLVRERDVNINEVVVDNDMGFPKYSETGSWTTSASSGYKGGTYRYSNSNSSETATAVFIPDIPEAGWYWISVHFKEGANRSTDVKYKVNHAGGQTVVLINQEVHGQTWVYLGEFYFDEGTFGNVTISNESSEINQAIISDAIRFGGGIGDMVDCEYGGSISGYPRFEEGARQYAMFQGYPSCSNDVSIRPKYAEYELSKGTSTEQNNAVYISWHTNAANGSNRGTTSYSYNGAGINPITPGSADLRDFVHENVMDLIHGLYDPTWQDRGKLEANFGELADLTSMPGCIIELAFHDNQIDVEALKTPYFRDLAAKGIYLGILDFFNNRDGSPNTKIPGIPTHVSAINIGNNSIQVDWNEPSSDISSDIPTGYKIYMSTHGKAFDNGTSVANNSLIFDNLIPGTIYYYRVSALNSGGESFPSSTIACRIPNDSSYVKYLLVDGFDRLDRHSSVIQNNDPLLGNVERMFVEQMNRYDYMIDHATAMGSCNYYFDGMQNEEVLNQSNLQIYSGIDWITGIESTSDLSLDVAEQALIINYLTNGGNLIISGAEIGWDLGRASSPNASISFYNNYLKATYLLDDGNSYITSGVSGTDFDGLMASIDDGSNGAYDVKFPDVLSPFGGSSTILHYTGGAAGGAAIAYKGNDFGVVYFGFPLETIYNPNERNNLFCTALHFLTPNICKPTYLLSNAEDPTLSYYQADQWIMSTKNMNYNSLLHYRGGEYIELLPGFEVPVGIDFSASIRNCPNNNDINDPLK